MPGYTKEQLEAKGARVSHYTLCENCNLFWHKRVFKKHLVPPLQARTTKAREIAIIHPAWANFLDFLAETAVRQLMEERAEKIRRGEPIDDGTSAMPAEKAADSAAEEPEVLTVSEAVDRLGVSREEILAEFEKNRVPFEFTIPAATRRARGQASTKRAPGT